MSTTNVVPFTPASSFDVKSFLGMSFGKDTSKTFAASFGGLAVKAGEKWIAPRLVDHRVEVLDVTGLTLPLDMLIYRVPVTFENLREGRFIVTPDGEPLFVLEKLADRIRGYSPGRSEEVTYVPPKNVFNVVLFAQVISLLDLFGAGGAGAGGGGGAPIFGGGGGAGGNLLPLLLLSRGGEKDSCLLALLAASGGLGGGALDQQQLLLLLLCKGGGGNGGGDDSLLETLLMLQALGGSLPFGDGGKGTGSLSSFSAPSRGKPEGSKEK